MVWHSGQNLHEGWAVEEGKAIEEDDNSDDSRWDEQICVPAQPQVVQGYLLPKVVPDAHEQTHTYVMEKYATHWKWYAVNWLCKSRFSVKFTV